LQIIEAHKASPLFTLLFIVLTYLLYPSLCLHVTLQATPATVTLLLTLIYQALLISEITL